MYEKKAQVQTENSSAAALCACSIVRRRRFLVRRHAALQAALRDNLWSLKVRPQTFADGVCAFDHFPAVLAVGTMAVPVVMLPFTWWWFPSTGRTAEYVAFTIEHDACESGSEDDVTE